MGNIILDPTADNGLKQQSEILVFHIRTVAKKRGVKRRGSITTDQLTQIKSNLIDIITY
jgi:mRNA interferase MazF